MLNFKVSPAYRYKRRRKSEAYQPRIVWDLGGQTSIRPYWRCYYANTDAIIYVIDACDKERVSTSKEELVAMLEEEEIKNAALLVFANKQVSASSMDSG